MSWLNRVYLCLFVSTSVMSASALAQNGFVNFETSQVHPIDLSPDRTTLAVCNTADARIELFDVSTGTPNSIGSVSVGVDPVTVRFRSNSEAWVVNHISDSVSIVDITAKHVTKTLQTKDEPCDVVFAGSPEMAFVSCSQVNTIQRFDPANLATPPTDIAIQAEDPRALAVSPDKTKVYAAIFESGNGSTIIAGGAAGIGTLGFPRNDALDDVTNPYAGVNPPPNDPNDTKLPDGQVWFPPKAANGTPPRVGLIVKKDAGGVWRDDNGEDWSPWVSGASATLSGRYTGWDLVDRDVAIISNLNAVSPSVAYADRLMNLCMAIAVNPASGEITVVGTDATNEIRFEPVIGGRFLRVEIGIVDASNATNISVVDLNHAHLAAAQPGGVDPYETSTVPQSERNKSIGDPRGIVWNDAGTRGYISGMGSNNVVVVQSDGERVVAGQTIEVREGPTGLALDDVNGRLYVLNKFDASVSVVSTASDTEVANVPFYDPTPPPIKIGRKHLYDTHKNSGLGHTACGSCHIDGRMDRLAWDLGDPSGAVKVLNGDAPGQHNLGAGIPGLTGGFNNFHPMKGPMTTQTLQDIIGKEPLHWRGDRDGLEQFNPAFMGLQGDDVMLSPVEMQQFEDFLASIHFPPNPYRNFDNSLPTNLPLPGEFASGTKDLPLGTQLPNGNAVNGLAIYRNQGSPADSPFTCIVCHTLPIGDGTDTVLQAGVFQPIPPGPMGQHHVALVSVDGSTNKAIKIPQLRNQFDKAGFQLNSGAPSLSGFGVLHDGSIDTLARFFSEPAFPNVNTDQKVADLVALVRSFSGGFSFVTPLPGEPPGGMSKDAPASVGKQTTLDSAAKDLSELTAMLALADAGQVDVIGKGVVAGIPRGWVYVGSGMWQSDVAAEGAISTATLLALAAPGTEITFSVVPDGTGIRAGIDRNANGLRDVDELGPGPGVPAATYWGLVLLGLAMMLVMALSMRKLAPRAA
ncbi:MAG: hypothetical protein K1Y02_06950 [Candidatus Hydrogenedentes bacterium]|nr:hypothetical protein [Candidatus Hydrogenedentota bacterium]